MLSLILLIFAFVFFVVSAVPATPEPWKSRLVCFGLACWVAADLTARAGPLLTR